MSDDPTPLHDPAALAAYVDAALTLQVPGLAPEAAARVREQFARVAAIAAPVLGFALHAEDEPAPVYRP